MKNWTFCAGSALLNICRLGGHTAREVIKMSYVNPALRPQFESLSVDLKNEILSRDVTLENLNDLISVLESIVSESQGS